MAQLLRGVKVVELAVLLTGDYVGMLLADEGADVVKVENTQVGDYIRDYQGTLAPGYSPVHLTVNRNKRSLTLDLHQEEGKAIFRRLIEAGDVFVTGNVADTTKRLGVDYDTLAAIKPDLIYCQATGFGAEGPFAAHPAHGRMMDAQAGAVAVTWGEDGLAHYDERGDTPTSHTSSGTLIGPIYAAFGVAAALAQRARTGEGAYIDVSCADSVIAGSWHDLARPLNQDRMTASETFPSPTDTTPDYNYYRASDGKYLIFCAQEPRFWENFVNGIGRDDLRDKKAWDELDLRRELQRIFAQESQDYWTAFFLQHRVAAGPVLEVDQIETDDHLRHREVLIAAEHPVAGAYRMVGNPIRVRGQSFELRHQAPSHGEHTGEVLAELGYTADDVAGLRERGVV